MENNQDCQCTCECCSAPTQQQGARRREQIITLVSAAVLFGAGWCIAEMTDLPPYVYLICYGICYMLVGFSVVRDAILGILSGNVFNEKLLMAVASIGAFAIKEYSEGCAVMILYTFGEMMQSVAIERSRRRVATELVEGHHPTRSTSEQFITRFARVYTPIVCALAVAIILIPPLLMHGEWDEWLHRGLSALVVSCPCAIVVSVPLCFFGGIGACSKSGIYVTDSYCIERLRKYTPDTTAEQVAADGISFDDFSAEKINAGVRIARRTLRIAWENIVLSIAVKLVILVLNVFLAQELPMWLAAFGDVGICLIAIVNSLRTLKK